MSKLVSVRIKDILPNPFRDLDEWPTLKDKVEEIKQSYEDTGFWDGYMIARSKGKQYEQAFGHHRLVAARELWGGEHKLTITVDDLSDDQMFKMMAQENSETYGQKFYLAVMQPIASLVKALADSKVKLEEPEPRQRGYWRLAPSFLVNKDGDPSLSYTATSIARYLSWTQGSGRDEAKASERVLTALSALELIERKVLKQKDFLPLSTTQAKALVDAVRGRERAEQAQINANVKVRQEALDLAAKQGDTNKAKRLEGEITDLEKEADVKSTRAAKAAGTAIAAEMRELDKRERAIVDAGAPDEASPTRVVKSATKVCYDLTAKAEGALLDTDPKHVKALEATPRAKSAYAEALRRLAKRAMNRAKELEA